MSLRSRKFVGAILLIVLVVGWSLLAMAFAQIVLPSAGGLAAFVYYAVAGIGWIFPAMPLIAWMSRDAAAK